MTASPAKGPGPRSGDGAYLPSTAAGRVWLRVRWTIAFWISSVMIEAGRFLPTRLCYAIANPLADFCFLILARHRDSLIANLARVVGPDEARPAARRAFRNFARYIVDLYQMPKRGREAVNRRVDFPGWQALDATLDESSCAVFVTLHLGLPELGGATFSNHRMPLNVLAESLHGPMDEFVQGLRRDLGMKVIPANKTKLGILRALRGGEALATLFDVVEGDEGIYVDLFGAPALVSSAPARIALKTSARVLPGVIARDTADPMRFRPHIDFGVRYQPTGDYEADVLNLTRAIAGSLERFILAYPDQWFAFRPVWDAPEKRASGTEKSPERWKEWSLAAAMAVGGRIPRTLAYGIARLSGDLAYHVRPHARRDVADNMRHVLGAGASRALVARHTREAFRNVARYYVDLVRSWEIRTLFERGQIRLHDFHRVQLPLAEGKGVVVATAHFGNPEVAVQVGAILGLDVLILAEPLPPSLARRMTRIRSQYGARYEDVGFNAVANALRHLRSGGALAITADRDIQGRGVTMPFFGADTQMPLGAVDFATRTGAVLVPGVCRRSGHGFDIYFEDPVCLVNTGRPETDTMTNARALLERVEGWITSDPGQWMVLDRIWKRP